MRESMQLSDPRDEIAPATPCNTADVWFICLAAALGGLLFGYDRVVIGGAKPFFEKYFDPTTEAESGWANTGARIGRPVGGGCHAGATRASTLLLVVAAIACCPFSLAPITGRPLAERFPDRIRGAAMSSCVSALRSGCFTRTYSFPLLNRALGAAGTSRLHAGIGAAGLLVIRMRAPATKGRTLEQIERELCGS